MEKDIAIIGMAGRFPEADNLEEFLASLRAGIDSVREIPEERLKKTGLPLDKEYKNLGFLNQIDAFDNSFFGILPAEALLMDPHQRMMMEVAYHMFENAGYTFNQLRNTNTAVILADNRQDYYTLAAEYDPLLFTGNLPAVTAGRIARFFGLRGNAMMIDTACSSSLVAIHMACRELIHREADMAVAGAVRLYVFPEQRKAQDNVGINSTDEKAKSFDAAANGTVGGEAAVCVLLKPLANALRDGDIIHAVIKSSAVNQDAHLSGSLTAPSSIAQTEMIQKAWRLAGIDPESIGFIEAHGTGTKLGDPLEIEGITRAFEPFTDNKQFCAISSVKSNIGHTDNAAGITGLVKAVLSLKNKELYPSLHFKTPNPFIDFINSPVFVNTEFTPWEILPGGKRRAGVNSFGLSGTNCHVVLEEFENTPVAQTNERTWLFTFSAQTPKSLERYLNHFREWLQDHPNSDVGDLSFTLNGCRNHFPYRLALSASDCSSLVEQIQTALLEDFISPEVTGDTWMVFSGDIPVTASVIDAFSKYEAFGEAAAQCRSLVSEDRWNAQAYQLVFYFSFYQLLRALGIDTNKVMGVGTGKICVDVITGKYDLQKGLQLCLQKNIATSTDLESKLRAFVASRLRAHTNVLVLECGQAGAITQFLQKEKIPTDTFSSLALPEADLKDGNLLHIVRYLYLKGVSINWTALYKHTLCKKVEIPGYEFDRKSYWLKRIEKDPVSNWMYQLEWARVDVEPKQDAAIQGSCLIFLEDAAGAKVCFDYWNGRAIQPVIITPAREYHKTEYGYAIQWNDEQSFQQLYHVLKEANVFVSAILYIQSPENKPVTGARQTLETVMHSLNALFLITRSFHELLQVSGMRYLIVTYNARSITPNEKLNFVQSAAHGFVVSASKEYPQLKMRALDLELDAGLPTPGTLSLLERELQSSDNSLVAGYRNGSRHVPVINKINISPAHPTCKYIPNGVYIVTGGASGIGLEVCRHIAAKEKVKLVIIGRRQLPLKKDWSTLLYDRSSEVSKAVHTFLEIERKGSEVYYFSCDLSNDKKLTGIIEDVVTSHGPVKGVIHAAGLPGGVMRVRNHTMLSFTETLLPKIHGTINLWDALQEQPLDFFISFSSKNAILGSDKSANYSAANLFLDQFMAYIRSKEVYAMSINWPSWREVGLWKKFSDYAGTDPVEYSLSILTQEGLRAFDLVTCCDSCNVIVSSVDPNQLGENPFFRFQQTTSSSLLPGIQTSHEVVAEKINYQVNPSWTPLENRVSSIWMQVLKIQQVDIDSNFFELGGHSLLAVKIIFQLQQELSVELEFADLFRNPTIRKLAHYIEGLQSANKDTVSLQKAPVAEYYPLSGAQRRLWILSHFQGGRKAYNVVKAVQISGVLETRLLANAFNTVVERHESLRTLFAEIEGTPLQKVVDKEKIGFSVQFLHLQNVENKELLIKQTIEEEYEFSFDLNAGPLFRVKLLQVNTDEHILIYNLHHIICDGISIDVLTRELLLLYNTDLAGVPEGLKPVAIQYKDFSFWQQQQPADALAAHKKYWAEQLKPPLQVPELPHDFARSKVLGFTGGSLLHVFNKEITSQLKHFARNEGTTLYPLLMAAFKVLLFKYTEKEDIFIGTNTSGRTLQELENMVGLLVNTVVVRTQPAKEKSIRSYLKEVEQTIFEAIKYQDYQFDDLVKDLGVITDPSRNPLFDIMFVYNTKLTGVGQAGNLAVKTYHMPGSTSRFDITVTFEVAEENLSMFVEYKKDVLYREESILLLIKRFEKLLTAIVENAAQTIGELEWTFDIEQALKRNSGFEFEFNF